jgi:hypothetical protein
MQGQDRQSGRFGPKTESSVSDYTEEKSFDKLESSGRPPALNLFSPLLVRDGETESKTSGDFAIPRIPTGNIL